MVINNSINRLTPVPIFSASTSINHNNVLGGGALYSVIADSVAFDLDSNYNNSTGIFVAPRSGTYFFSGIVKIESIPYNSTQLYIYLSTNSNIYRVGNIYAVNMRTYSNLLNMPWQILINLNNGDTAQFNIQLNGGAQAAKLDAGTIFSGSFIFEN